MQNLTAVSYNCIDLEQFQRLNLFTVFGAIFLIVPGFLTDIFGILLQFSAFTSMIVNRYNVQSGQCNKTFTKDRKDEDIIDVEIIEHHTADK